PEGETLDPKTLEAAIRGRLRDPTAWDGAPLKGRPDAAGTLMELEDGRTIEGVTQPIGGIHSGSRLLTFRGVSSQVNREKRREIAEASFLTIFNLATE